MWCHKSDRIFKEWALWYLLITLFHNSQDTWWSRSQSLYLEMRDHKALLKVSGVWWVGPSTPLPYFLATNQTFLNKLFFFFLNATLIFWKHTSKNSSKKYFILSKRMIFISLLRDGFFGVCFCFFFFCFDNLLSLKFILGIFPVE